jgi:hypothetical protein
MLLIVGGPATWVETKRALHAAVRALERADRLRGEARIAVCFPWHETGQARVVAEIRDYAEVAWVSWAELAAEPSLDGCEFIDLNDGRICADSFILHWLAMRGAYAWGSGSRMKRKGDRWVPLSPHHGVWIHFARARATKR